MLCLLLIERKKERDRERERERKREKWPRDFFFYQGRYALLAVLQQDFSSF
jgi:hypothetical protein